MFGVEIKALSEARTVTTDARLVGVERVVLVAMSDIGAFARAWTPETIGHVKRNSLQCGTEMGFSEEVVGKI